MEINAIKSSHPKICELLFSRKVFEASNEIRKLIQYSGREYYSDQLEQHMLTYENLLNYTFVGTKDPQRDQVYMFLIRALLEMADEITEFLLTQAGAGIIYQQKQQFIRESKKSDNDAMAFIELLALESQFAELIKDTGVEAEQDRESYKQGLSKLFYKIWLTDKVNETEINILRQICDTDLMPWHEKCLIVSSLTLSLLRYYDVNKLISLFRFVYHQEKFVWHRALIGLFICFRKYNDRVHLYPALAAELKKLSGMDNIDKHIEAILIQYTKTRETEIVTKKWERDILPGIMKLRPKIEEKLDLDNIFGEDMGEGKNPEWETVFEDVPDLLSKLQEFTELQLGGMDVFMSTFSQLKNFPFFQKLSNWFVPFYHENESLKDFINNPSENVDLTPLIQKLENTMFMCNSDKYSFCLNLLLIPPQQKSRMMNMINAEMENISEIEKSEESINNSLNTRSIFTQYFQDLYRFVKLHPWHGEFDDIFAEEINIFHTTFVSSLLSDIKTIRNIAEFYFDQKFYTYALSIFLSLAERDKENIEMFEKIAFCYENQADFEKALEYYHKADLRESNRTWILKKLAVCCKNLHRWDSALEYYKQAAMLKPDDMKIQANIGQCLIYTHRYEEALEYYFKVEVLAPENHRIRRPLAWCLFILGKFETAGDYLQRLLADEPANMHDLMNLAHVMWCMGNQQKAFELYCQSYRACENTTAFDSSFNDDRKHLLKHNIDPFEIDLMLEYVKIKSKNKP